MFGHQRKTWDRGLLLGWQSSDEGKESQFTQKLGAGLSNGQALVYDGDSHLITCAPTGMGKGRGVLIPNSLLYEGPLIAIDPKAELLQCVGRRRREMGQQVYALDPFHIAQRETDSLNPLDLLELPGSNIDVDAEMFASLLAVGHEFNTDPFWSDTGKALISGLIAHVATSYPPAERHLGRVRDWLYHEDMEMAMATALDNKDVQSRVAWDQFVAYLGAPAKETRPCIRTTASTYLSVLGSPVVRCALQKSSFSLKDVVDGRPLSIFITIPPDKLESHRSLLRLWVGTLLTAVSRRKHIPRQRTLFLLDECAQLGELSALRQAVTLLRGSGLQVWTIWQDLSQLRLLYPRDWQTMVNNSAALQVFGINNNLMAREWSEVLGMEPARLLNLTPEQAVVHLQGQGTRICRRPDYLRDQIFAGLFDANERFALQPQAVKNGGPRQGGNWQH